MHGLAEIAEYLLLHPVGASAEDQALRAFASEDKPERSVLVGYEFNPSSIAAELWSERIDDIFFHRCYLNRWFWFVQVGFCCTGGFFLSIVAIDSGLPSPVYMDSIEP